MIQELFRWYPDILPKDTLPKDNLPKDTLPNGHFADGHFVERTFCRTDSVTNRLFAEKTSCRNDNLPKIEQILGVVTHFSKMCNSQSLYNYKITIVWLLPYTSAWWVIIGGFSFLEKYDSWQAAILPRRASKQRIHCWESARCIEQRSEHISDQPFCLPSLWLSMSYVCLFIDPR